MDSNSSPIISVQQAPHKDLCKIVQKHRNTLYKREIPTYAIDEFKKVEKFIQRKQHPIVLDSGCGTGESSYKLANNFPNHWVIAIEKSQHRLARSHAYGELPSNLIFVRCDVIHFWRLIVQAQWPVDYHYLLYPNPWPKLRHLQRRWHGHPIFPTLIALSKSIFLRTNWQVYAQEFALALELCTGNQVSFVPLKVIDPISAFERKYQRSGHALYALEYHMDL